MDGKLVEDFVFEIEDFSQKPLPAGDYEYGTFNNCNFSETELYQTRFLECEFNESNLSNAKLTQTVLRDVKFINCKMLGLVLDEATQFHSAISFDGCVLDYISFYGKSLKSTLFKNYSIREADFSACDLTGSSFEGCDLTRSKFENSVLEKCDFRNAENFMIDPQMNKIKKAKFSLQGLPGLLNNYDIIIE